MRGIRIFFPFWGSDGPSWLASHVRTAARTALRERDLQEQVRAASRKKITDCERNGVVCEKSASICCIRTEEGQRSDTRRWRGLTVILAVKGPCRYFIRYRNGTSLVAAEDLLDASLEEAAAAEVVGDNFDLGGEQLEDFDLKEGEPVPS